MWFSVKLEDKMVLALSAADIPVVTPPPLKSTETERSHGISIITDHDVILLYSGFQLMGTPTSVSCHEVDHFWSYFSAAAKKSPSFSRSSSSTYDYFSLTDVFIASSIVLSCILFVIMVAIYFLDGNNFEIIFERT
jgi:hypothetical protein